MDRRRGLKLGFLALLLGLAGPAHAAGLAPVWPGSKWASASPSEVGMDPVALQQGVAYAQQFGGSGMVVRKGYRVVYWGDQTSKPPLRSATKSFGSILLGIALGQDKIALGQKAQSILPGVGTPPNANKATGWLPLITVENLATHTAGFEKPGDFQPLTYKPGTAWKYSDGGANWLADLLTLSYGQDLDAVLRAKVFKPLQVSTTDYKWINNAYRTEPLSGIKRRSISAGIFMNVGAMARVGLMLARDGKWKSKKVVPAGYVEKLGVPPAILSGLTSLSDNLPKGPQHYGYLFWNNADGIIAGAPSDMFWAWGLDEQLIVVVPSLDLVLVRNGVSGFGTKEFGSTKALIPFITPITQAVTTP